MSPDPSQCCQSPLHHLFARDPHGRNVIDHGIWWIAHENLTAHPREDQRRQHPACLPASPMPPFSPSQPSTSGASPCVGATATPVAHLARACCPARDTSQHHVTSAANGREEKGSGGGVKGEGNNIRGGVVGCLEFTLWVSKCSVQQLEPSESFLVRCFLAYLQMRRCTPNISAVSPAPTRSSPVRLVSTHARTHIHAHTHMHSVLTEP